MVAGMPVPAPSPVVIACPHCSTRYQVAYATIGAKGRSVQCAHCGKTWQAHTEPPPDFEALAEEKLDERFAEEERHARNRVAGRIGVTSEPSDPSTNAAVARARSSEHLRTIEQIRATIGPKPRATEELDPATSRQRQQAFSRRQRSVYSKLPVARLRRGARIAVVVALTGLIVGGVALRVPIVQQFPQLAGPYAALGLGVNVIGLEFAGVQTLKSLQQGAEVLVVEGRIASAAATRVSVPPVVVTLLGAHREPLYEWSMPPRASDLGPGESVPFTTQLSKPPGNATEVKLSFATGRPGPRPGDAGDTSLNIGEADDGQNSAR
jgi:predicted Zn finger-like uncharacterized protein